MVDLLLIILMLDNPEVGSMAETCKKQAKNLAWVLVSVLFV